MRGKKTKSSASHFNFHLENELVELCDELSTGAYRPSSYYQFEIKEPKPRKICSSAFRDRVVHHAICNIIEPLFEKRAIADSYACRKGRGSHMAIKRCQQFTRGFGYFLKCDIRKYFESVDHEILKRLYRRIFKDDALLALLDLIVDHTVPGNLPGKGIPIGNLTSQHFANFYLSPLDHFIKTKLRVKGYVRYMDDFILFADDKADLHRYLHEIENFVANELRLDLKAKATTIAPVSQGVPFLGFRVFRNLIRLQRTNLVRLRRNIRRREKEFSHGLISEKELVLSMSSMIGHVSHVSSLAERKNIFEMSLKMA